MEREQGVQFRQRARQVGDAVVGDRAGVAGDGRLVGIGGERSLRRIEKPPELRHHPVVGSAQRLRGFVRDPALPLQMVADEADTLPGQRVGAEIGVPLRRREPLALLQPLEHVQEAARGLPGAGEEPHGRLVGRLLLRPAVAQERLLRHALAADNDRAADLALSRR